ncbi:heme ABC transporter ATP-binding protein [Flaviflexus massiliensis]|uniref:heme ABC transporter ATP-binding protein n=1 Tax=Flaviflexus massiliensis TaxID=1522309 RepID=UPI0009E6877A|nr:heme ABC transporter ATP-binding protein [Flaviflexus massiliensis]
MMLEIHEASVVYDGHAVLDRASLSFTPGKVTAIIGPNGAGKSTLLNVGAGHLQPSSGSVTLDGRDIKSFTTKEAARRRAVMPQDVTVAFPFTVREVVAMGRTPWDTPTTDNDEIVDAALDLTDLDPFTDREMTTLSGGERQRVALARIIVQAAPIGPQSILLLDEPTAAMDIGHAEETLSLTRRLASQGATVGVVIHDIDAALSYADQVVLMSHGKIDIVGPAAEVCTAEALTRVYNTPIDVISVGGSMRVLPKRPAIGFSH